MTRTIELTAKLLDDTLSEAEGAELDALIASDPAAEAEQLTLLELEAELRGLRTDFDLTHATLAMIQVSQGERTADAVLAQIASAPSPSWASPLAEPISSLPTATSHRRRAMWFGGSGLLACAAALVVGLWLGMQNPNPSNPEDTRQLSTAFAKLSHMAGSVELLTPSGDVITAEEGGELPAGFTIRTIGDDSLAVVEFLHDMTRVEIEPDSVVRFAGDASDAVRKPRLYLASGQLTAAVPQRPDDQGLTVATGVAEVFARHGIFVVSSAGPDSARVDIKQGNVEVMRPVAPRPVPLSKGRAAVVFAGNDRLDIERMLSVDHLPKRTLVGAGIRDAVFSPNGEEVWVATARYFSRWGANGKISEMGFYPRRGNEGIAAFTRDKRFLVTFRGERDDRILIRTLPDGGEFTAINARPQDPRLWTVSPDASWLAIVDPRPNNKRVHVVDGTTNEERFIREFDDAAVTCVTSAPDGKTLAIGLTSTARGVSNKVVLLNAQTNDRLSALSVLKRPVTAMTFSADGRYLAVGFNGTIQLWDVQKRELLRSITGFERALTCLAFAPDGNQLAAGTQDGHVWLWDTDSGRHTQLIELGGRGVRAIAFSPDGKQLVTVGNSVPVAVWDVRDSLIVTPGL